MFIIGKEYRRQTEIHDVYGGQRQGGISTPSSSNHIFIFTSDNGHQYGYEDKYRSDGIFLYTGEGQSGPMQMLRGNKAIRDHVALNKEIHVFESTRKAYVRYIGTADYLGFHEEKRPDGENNLRDAFIFHLAINSNHDGVEAEPSFEIPSPKILKKKTTKQLRNFCLLKLPKKSELKKKLHFTYVRSEAIKLYVNARSKGICEGCEEPAPFKTNKGPFLECHHIHRLSDGGPDHPQNVAALCPNCHRRAHHSIDAVAFNKQLINKVFQLEA